MDYTFQIIGFIVSTLIALCVIWLLLDWLIRKSIGWFPMGTELYFREYTSGRSIRVSMFGFQCGGISFGIIRHKYIETEPSGKVDPTISDDKEEEDGFPVELCVARREWLAQRETIVSLNKGLEFYADEMNYNQIDEMNYNQIQTDDIENNPLESLCIPVVIQQEEGGGVPVADCGDIARETLTKIVEITGNHHVLASIPQEFDEPDTAGHPWANPKCPDCNGTGGIEVRESPRKTEPCLRCEGTGKLS